MCICEVCKKEHRGYFESGRFCSIECKSKFIGNKLKNVKKIKCELCGHSIKEFNFQKHLYCHEKNEKKKQEKLNTTHICECCGKEHKMTFGSGRFCSIKCANTRILTQEIKQKIRKKLIKNEHNYCISCTTEIFGRRILCDECKKFIQYKKMFSKLNIFEQNLKIANDKALTILKTEYFDNHLTLGQIRDKYNIQYNTVFFFFRKNGIKLRTFSEAGSVAYLEGRQHPQSNGCFKRGWHKTWDGKEIYFRSSYELNYAKELDDYKIKYNVENIRIQYFDTIKQKNRTSVVDFHLPDLNMLVEIKSSYTLNLQNMKDKFKEYIKQGYKTKLIVDGLEMKI